MKKSIYLLAIMCLMFLSNIIGQTQKETEPVDDDLSLLVNQKNNLVYSGLLTSISDDTINIKMNKKVEHISATLIYHPEDRSYIVFYNDEKGNQVKEIYKEQIDKSSTCLSVIDSKGGNWCVLNNLKNNGQLKFYSKSKNNLLLFNLGKS